MTTSLAEQELGLRDVDPAWVTFLSAALVDWKAERLFVKRQLSGKSGAIVYLVEATTSEHNGLGILKLSESKSSTDENSLQDLATQLSPRLVEHTPRFTQEFKEDGRSALLMTVAGDSLLEVEVLSASTGGALNRSLQLISSSLLEEWSDTHKFSSPVQCNDVLSSWLGTRLDDGSRLSQIVPRILNVAPTAKAFRYGGIDYPNPFTFSKSPPLQSSASLSPLLGPCHGDLHAENILTNSSGKIPRYYYIDFALFRDNVPVFFDHAYLELSLLLRNRADASHQRWHELCQSLFELTESRQVADAALSTDDQGLLWNVAMIRGEINRWRSSKFPQRSEDIKKQVLLSRVAAGLNYANKRILSEDAKADDKLRFFCLLYAASAAREFNRYCKIPTPDDGEISKPPGEMQTPATDNWRQVWQACEGFDSRRASYILLSGPECGALAGELQEGLGRLPWSVVLDFDPQSPSSGLLRQGGTILRRTRGLHQIFPHQSANIDFNTGTCWMLMEGDPEDGTPRPSLPEWRRQTQAAIRTLGSDLHATFAPRPIYLVILGGEVDAARLRSTYLALEEALVGKLRPVVVSPPGDTRAHEALASEGVTAVTVACDWRDFALGIHQILGELQDSPGTWIPSKDPDGTLRRRLLSPEEVALFNATLEIFPCGALPIRELETEISDFLHGNTITHRELDLHRDVDRDVATDLTNHLRNLFQGPPPAESFAIEHSVGAGGSSLARRIAWDLRNEVPCVSLRAYSSDAVDNIEAITQGSNLPILILAESSILPGVKRDLLFNDLKSRNIRFVILDVRRRRHPHTSNTSVALVDPMLSPEAERFLAEYKSRTPDGQRHSSLDQLARSPSLSQYRSAFFFGLYAFEDKFLRIGDFVSYQLSIVPEELRHAFAYLALITRYSQERLPYFALPILAGFGGSGRDAASEAILSESYSKLIMFDGEYIGICHPLLAEELLRQFLRPEGSDRKDAWRANLSRFCVDFIETMADEEIRDSDWVVNILSDIFIDRGFWGGNSLLSLFSELINELNSDYGSKVVLEKLCEHFPREAHFWGHLGRFINLSQTGSFEDAEAKFLRAIALQPEDDVHHHGLGMVYRFEVRNRLSPTLGPSDLTRDRLENIRDIFDKAMASFAKARSLSGMNEYPLVTPIQMIIETVERLASLSRFSDYPAFLARADVVSDWCREQISEAKWLLDQLRHLEANSEPGKYRTQCEGRLNGVLGNFAAMVDGLSSLLIRPDVVKAPIRRLLADAYLRRTEVQDRQFEIANLRRIVQLMDDNLSDDPGKSADIRTWLRAYRSLPEFSSSSAIERLTEWSLLSESVDAHYYLHVLHFLNARQGVHSSSQESKRHLEICKRRASVLLSKKSFEWYANPDLSRPCPLVHHSELGSWSKESDFFSGVDRLGFLEGRIEEIKSPQSGTILIGGMPAFFVPRSQFRRSAHLNSRVKFFLGFSYEGMRAWNVTGLDEGVGG